MNYIELNFSTNFAESFSSFFDNKNKDMSYNSLILKKNSCINNIKIMTPISKISFDLESNNINKKSILKVNKSFFMNTILKKVSSNYNSFPIFDFIIKHDLFPFFLYPCNESIKPFNKHKNQFFFNFNIFEIAHQHKNKVTSLDIFNFISENKKSEYSFNFYSFFNKVENILNFDNITFLRLKDFSLLKHEQIELMPYFRYVGRNKHSGHMYIPENEYNTFNDTIIKIIDLVVFDKNTFVQQKISYKEQLLKDRNIKPYSEKNSVYYIKNDDIKSTKTVDSNTFYIFNKNGNLYFSLKILNKNTLEKTLYSYNNIPICRFYLKALSKHLDLIDGFSLDLLNPSYYYCTAPDFVSHTTFLDNEVFYLYRISEYSDAYRLKSTLKFFSLITDKTYKYNQIDLSDSNCFEFACLSLLRRNNWNCNTLKAEIKKITTMKKFKRSPIKFLQVIELRTVK